MLHLLLGKKVLDREKELFIIDLISEFLLGQDIFQGGARQGPQKVLGLDKILGGHFPSCTPSCHHCLKDLFW